MPSLGKPLNLNKPATTQNAFHGTQTTPTPTAAKTEPEARMTHQEAMRKAAKLLRLATSSNPNEAAAAAAKAQEIMDRYKLSGDSLNLEGNAPEEKVIHCPQDPLERDANARWKGFLAVSISKANQCQVYATSGTYCLIGRPSDMQAVRYLYAWLVQEVQRLTDAHCVGCGRTYRNNFSIGCTETIGEKLREQRKQTVEAVKAEAFGNEKALVLVQNSLAKIAKQEQDVEQYARSVLKIRKGRTSRTTYDHSARQAGREAGKSINIASRTSLGGGNLRLS